MNVNAHTTSTHDATTQNASPGALESPQSATKVSIGSAAKVIVAGYIASMAVLVTAGFVLTRTLKKSGIVRWDESVVQYFADHRTPSLTHLSAFWSRSADAPSIIVIAVVVGIVLALRRNWREIAWIAVIVPTELLFFLTVSYAVGRKRPDVEHLGSVPSTGSFPSGHVAVTIVLYGTIALIISAHLRARSPKARRAVAIIGSGWTLIAASFVGWARIYRGMHHPLDVAAGTILGCAVLYVGFFAFQRSTKYAQFPSNTLRPRPISNAGAVEHQFSTQGEVT